LSGFRTLSRIEGMDVSLAVGDRHCDFEFATVRPTASSSRCIARSPRDDPAVHLEDAHRSYPGPPPLRVCGCTSCSAANRKPMRLTRQPSGVLTASGIAKPGRRARRNEVLCRRSRHASGVVKLLEGDHEQRLSRGATSRHAITRNRDLWAASDSLVKFVFRCRPIP
jgi:hypothetical protein